MKLTSTVKYPIKQLKFSLYNIVKRRAATNSAGYLPLYQSRVFSTDNLQSQLKNSEATQRYRQFLPYILISQTGMFKPKHLVTQLQFNPQAETLKIVTVQNRAFTTQQFSINNIVPITYADMRAFNRSPEPDLPPYIDDTMTYLNRFNQDTYVFEQDGQWNEATVNHPKLSVEARLNEKEWFDRWLAY